MVAAVPIFSPTVNKALFVIIAIVSLVFVNAVALKYMRATTITPFTIQQKAQM
jgi:hypothetical protein